MKKQILAGISTVVLTLGMAFTANADIDRDAPAGTAWTLNGQRAPETPLVITGYTLVAQGDTEDSYRVICPTNPERACVTISASHLIIHGEGLGTVEIPEEGFEPGTTDNYITTEPIVPTVE